MPTSTKDADKKAGAKATAKPSVKTTPAKVETKTAKAAAKPSLKTTKSGTTKPTTTKPAAAKAAPAKSGAKPKTSSSTTSTTKGGKGNRRAAEQKERDARRAAKRAVRKHQSPRWYAFVMVGLMLFGLAWLVVTYVAQAQYPIPRLGQWNLAVGGGFMLVGFGMTAGWK